MQYPLLPRAAGRTTIIIPNYEAREEIDACLKMIPLMTEGDYRVVVVDNGSSAETKHALRGMASRSDKISVVDYDEQAGFTHAVNAGLSMASGDSDYVVIMNNDTVPTIGWLDELAIVFKHHSDCGMSVPRQVLPPNHPTSKRHVPGSVSSREVDANLSAHHQNVLNPTFDTKNGIIELNFAPLFCTMMKADDIRALGFLDAENGAHFRSDWILCDAVRRYLGKRILYTQHSKVYHFQGVSTVAKSKAA